MKKGTLFLLVLGFCFSAHAQETSYDIQLKKGIPVKYEDLSTAEGLVDLNPGYPDLMIAEEDYLSTKMESHCNGTILAGSSLNNNLSIEQKKVLAQIKQGCYIEVEVNYYQENAATQIMDLRQMQFVLRVLPETEATYLGGEEKLITYFKSNLSNELTKTLAQESVVVAFTIDASGTPTQVSLLLGAEDEQTNQHILDVVRKMPRWSPAVDVDGKAIPQEFEFIAGSMVGC